MVEGRKTGTSGELKKSGISWQLDTSAAYTSESSRPASTCTTPKGTSIKRSASSLATSLINSLGGGSVKKTDTPISGWESPTRKSSGSSFTAISSSSSFSAGASAAAISNAAAARPASPSIAALQQPAASLIKSTDMSSLSWSGISSTAASVAPSTSLASLTDPGVLSLTRLTHKPGQASKLLPDAVFIPDTVAHAHTASSNNVTFLEPATSDLDDADLEDLSLPGASQCSSGGSKIGTAPLMLLGSSSVAVVASQRMLSGTTPNNSAAGSGAEAMLRQKSRVSFLIDEDMHAALKESFGVGGGSSVAIRLGGAKSLYADSNSSEYKRSNTTGLIGMKVKTDDLNSGGFFGDPDDSNRSAGKKDILAAFAKLTSASADANGSNSNSDSKEQALAYKHQIGFLPSPSASSAGNRQTLKQVASVKSNLSWAGTAAVHIAHGDEDREGDDCLLPALPPGAIPSFTTAGSNAAGVSNISSSSSSSNIRSPPAAVKSAKALSPNAIQQEHQPSLLGDSAEQQHSVQFSVAQIPKTLELLPPHVTEPTLLAVSGRLAPAMQRPHWCMADFVTQKKLYEGYASTILKAFDKLSGSTVALKLYHLNKLNTISSHQVAREIRLHIGLNHENIIALYAAFQEAGNIVLVQEFASGGDLWSFIDSNSGRLTERVTVSLVLQPFLKAAQYLHSAGIAHRDIKPENVLFTSNMVLKVADFGLAVNLREERAVTRVGTLDYMAPEVLRCPLKRHPGDNKDRADLHYSQAVDAWAVGVLAYELLIGRAPFSAVGASDSAIEAAIQCGSPAFPSRMSEPAADFIAAALDKQPDRRPSILQMLHHGWIRSFQRSSSNGRAEQRSSQDYGGTGRLLIPNSTSAAQPTTQQRQQQDKLPQLTPPKGQSKKGLSGLDSTGANAAAAGVYHTDDNGMTGYAVSGGW